MTRLQVLTTILPCTLSLDSLSGHSSVDMLKKLLTLITGGVGEAGAGHPTSKLGKFL